jgi:hypothetical protein
MSAIKNRSSIMAVVAESTTGTYVPPSAGSDALALQPGFSMSPNFNQIENAEIKASIGLAKTLQGLEVPQSAFDHYLRPSGVEGQAPNFNLILKSLLGSVSSNGTERSTTTGSTATVVHLAAGGSDFARGKSVLSKHGSGYEMRPVLSVSTNNLTLAFALTNVPGSGVAMGKCVNYAPANSGHPTLSLTLYRGNGGAVEAMAGARVTQGTFTAKSGDAINAAYQFQGTKYFLDPITLPATKYIDFTDDTATFAASLAAQTFRDPYEAAQALQDAMNAANPLNAKTVSYSSATGKFSIVGTGTLLSLLFLTGTNNASSLDTYFGFTHTDKTGTGATTGYSGGNTITLTFPYTPAYDSADPQIAKGNEVFIGDVTDTTCFCASSIDITVTNEVQNVECVCADSGVQEQIILRRSIEIKLIGILESFNVDKFRRYRSNADAAFLYNYGTKSGGNWVPGKCGNIFVPLATISAFQHGDNNGIATVEVTVKPYVDSTGAGEFYVNFH